MDIFAYTWQVKSKGDTVQFIILTYVTCGRRRIKDRKEFSSRLLMVLLTYRCLLIMWRPVDSKPTYYPGYLKQFQLMTYNTLLEFI